MLFRCLRHQRIKQQVGDVIGQRAAEEEFHGEVVHALRIRLFVCFLGEHPSLRKDISDGSRDSCKALTQANQLLVDDIVEMKMPFVQPVRSHKLNGAAPVLFEELGRIFPRGLCRCSRDVFCSHRNFPFLSRPIT
jgi:hypothetical protein